MNLVIDSVFVMLVCFVLGALIAWLLYPTRRDLRQLDEQHEGDAGSVR